MNLEEHIRIEFIKTFRDAMPPVSVYRAGYQKGLSDGLCVTQQVEDDRAKLQQQSDRDIGHAQGLSHAAFIASHCTLPPNIGEAGLRDLIVRAIEKAATEPVKAEEAKA